jgi:hypothetical protein
MTRSDQIRLQTGLAKPMLSSHNLPISVTKYYTDVDGAFIDKNTIATNLKTPLPFYLFNYYDYIGGYKIGFSEVPLNPNWKLFQYNVYGTNDFRFFTGLNEVKNWISIGDLVFIYTDDLNLPNVYCWVIISAGNASIASINESMNENAEIEYILYDVQNESNYRQNLFYVRETFLMQPRVDSINPKIWQSPYNRLSAVIKAEIKYKFSKMFGLYSYIDFVNDTLNFEFKIKHLE